MRLHAGVLRNFPSDNSQWVVGASAGGLRFDGIDDYVEIGHLPIMSSGNPRTVTAWIKLNSIPTAGQTLLVWGRQPAAEHWRLEVDANRRLRFLSGAGYAVASRVVGDIQWHHIAVALDPLVPNRPRISDIRLYVDARPQAVYELNEQEVTANAMEDLRIGASYDLPASPTFDGIIDDVRLYDTALSPAHVRQIYNAALPQ